LGEGKERPMLVCNKERPYRNKINNSSMVSFKQILFFSTQKVSSDILLAAMTACYSITSLIFTSLVSDSYFKRDTYNSDWEVS